MKMTPGPWRTERDAVGDDGSPLLIYGGPNDLVVADCAHEMTAAFSDEEAEANARAIAALPELVEALKVAAVALSPITSTASDRENRERFDAQCSAHSALLSVLSKFS